MNDHATTNQSITLKTLTLHPVPRKYQGNDGKCSTLNSIRLMNSRCRGLGRWVLFHIVDYQNKLLYSQDNPGCLMTRSARTLTIETSGIGAISGDFKVQFSYYQLWKVKRKPIGWGGTDMPFFDAIEIPPLSLLAQYCLFGSSAPTDKADQAGDRSSLL